MLRAKLRPLLRPILGHLVGAIVVLAAGQTAFGQALEIKEGSPLRIESLKVSADVTEGIALVDVDQTFRNETDQQQEGFYRFRLPANAVVHSFSMWMNGKEKQGRVLESKQARRIYDTIVASKKDPALLEEIGWRRFQVSVFPIPARDTVRIRLVYAHIVDDDLGLRTLEIPLPEGAPVGVAEITVNVRDKQGVAVLDCPTHSQAQILHDDVLGAVTWSEEDFAPQGPFRVRSAPAYDGLGLACISHRAEESTEGTFLVRVVPRLDKMPELPRDVVFVIDRSGSMKGEKLEQARAALLHGLKTLRENDRFSVIAFSSGARAMKGGLRAVDDASITDGRRFAEQLTASGGTNIDDALQEALKLRGDDPGRLFVVAFLTDGNPTVGEKNPDRIVKRYQNQSQGKVRLFAFGVGNDVEDFLLTRLSKGSRGAAEYVRENEDLEVKLSMLFDKVQSPILTDLEIRVVGDDVHVIGTEPEQIPDVFRGTAVVMSGRYTGHGPVQIQMTGRVGTELVEITQDVELPAAAGENAHVAQLWARMRIDRLLDELRIHGMVDEIKQEIIRLGLRYQVVTPYTSFLIVEDDIHIPDDAELAKVPEGPTTRPGGGGGAAGGGEGGGPVTAGGETGGPTTGGGGTTADGHADDVAPESREPSDPPPSPEGGGPTTPGGETGGLDSGESPTGPQGGGDGTGGNGSYRGPSGENPGGREPSTGGGQGGGPSSGGTDVGSGGGEGGGEGESAGGASDSGPGGPSSSGGAGRSPGKSGVKRDYSWWSFWWQFHADTALPAPTRTPIALVDAQRKTVVDALRRVALDASANFFIRSEAQRALARIGDDAGHVTGLAERMLTGRRADGEAAFHRVCEERAGRLPLERGTLSDTDRAHLLEVLADNERKVSYVRPFAALTLALRGDAEDDEIRLALQQTAIDGGDGRNDLRAASFLAMGLQGNGDAASALETIVASGKMLGGAHVADKDLAYAIDGLGRLGAVADEKTRSDAIATLLRALTSKKHPAYAAVARRAIPTALARLATAAHGNSQSSIVKALESSIRRDRDASVRNFGALSLGRIAADASVSEQARRAARTALRKLWNRAPEGTREFVALGLGVSGADGDAEKLLLDGIVNGSPDLQGACAIALGISGGKRHAASLALLAANRGTSAEARIAALRVLESVADENALEIVKAAAHVEPGGDVVAAMDRVLAVRGDAKAFQRQLDHALRGVYDAESFGVVSQAGDIETALRLAAVVRDEKQQFADVTRGMAARALGEMASRPDPRDAIAVDFPYRAYAGSVWEFMDWR